MSWDVFISRHKVDDLQNEEFKKIGSKQEVIDLLTKFLPDIQTQKDDWVLIKKNDYSIEIDLGDEDTIDHLMLYVRGDTQVPMIIIKEICVRTNCYAMDCYDSSQIDFSQIENKSLKEWQLYRDKILNQ
jgi:hypothetical protein